MSSEKIFHLVGSESGAICGLYKGAGPCLSLSPAEARIGRIWASFGETAKWPNICRGQNASFGVNVKRAKQIFLQMDVFGRSTNSQFAVATARGRKTCKMLNTQKYGLELGIWILDGGDFQDVLRHLQEAWIVENVWLWWWPWQPPSSASSTCQGHRLWVDLIPMLPGKVRSCWADIECWCKCSRHYDREAPAATMSSPSVKHNLCQKWNTIQSAISDLRHLQQWYLFPSYFSQYGILIFRKLARPTMKH